MVLVTGPAGSGKTTVAMHRISYILYNYRERSVDEILPWDFIDIGVTKAFMKREWENARKGVVTPNCREKCSACGAFCYEGGVCREGKI